MKIGLEFELNIKENHFVGIETLNWMNRGLRVYNGLKLKRRKSELLYLMAYKTPLFLKRKMSQK